MFYPKGYIPVLDSDEYLAGIKTTRRILGDISKKYCFQLEKGEKTGRYHLQGRFSLKAKDTCEATAVKLRKLGWDDFRLSYTSEENRTNMFYVSKEETREDGPFDDTNELIIPLEVQMMKVLRPWQDTMLELLKGTNMRGLDIVVDLTGNTGKSAFTKYMITLHDARKLFYCKEYRDVMRMAYCLGEAPIYICDIPRAIPKNNLKDLFAGLEELKGGLCYDDRNTFRYRVHFSNPRVLVFTNVMPDLNMLSADRWNMWRITDSMKLKRLHAARSDYIDDLNEGAYDQGIHMSSSSDESLSEDILVSRDVSSSEGDSSSESTEESPKRRTTKTKKDKRSDKVQTISKKKRTAKK